MSFLNKFILIGLAENEKSTTNTEICKFQGFHRKNSRTVRILLNCCIRWDEETIRMHDTERGTRQKIDEPGTPYCYYDSSTEELEGRNNVT